MMILATIARSAAALLLLSICLLGVPMQGAERRGGEGPPPEGMPSSTVDGEKRLTRAIDAALQWLKRHQHADGHWASHDFYSLCKDPQKHCRSEKWILEEERGYPGHDVGVTGLALLAFVGAGHTHTSDESEHREVVEKALEWILAQQQGSGPREERGRFGGPEAETWIYNHAIATQAIARLLLRSGDKQKLRKPLRDAVRLCLRARTKEYGWKYRMAGKRNDSSVTGWMMEAVQAARECVKKGLLDVSASDTRKAIRGGVRWYDTVTSSVSGITGYETPGDEGSRLQKGYPEPYPFSKKLPTMTAVSILCRLKGGVKPRDPSIEQGCELLRKHPPRWREIQRRRHSTINYYYWYHGARALAERGGKGWREWRSALEKALLDHQRDKGCEAGSWDTKGEWCLVGGRVYATAICALTLETAKQAGKKRRK